MVPLLHDRCGNLAERMRNSGLRTASNVRRSGLRQIVCWGLVTSVAVGCSKPPVASLSDAPRYNAPSEHFLPLEEAAVANAGAQRCTYSPPIDIDGLDHDARFAVGFGERGGLVAWSATNGTHVRPWSMDGRFTGSTIVHTQVPLAKPIEIAPIGRGFVAILKRVETQDSVCGGRCIDATCAGWPAGTPQPQVCAYTCSKPCRIPSAHEFVLLYLDMSGQIIGTPKVWRTGLFEVESILAGDGRSVGILTGETVIWVRVDEHDSLTMRRQPLPGAKYLLPIRGRGAPSLLGLSEEGEVLLVDEKGEHLVRGNLVDPRAGRFVDARLQARRDSTGRIHVAQQAWTISLDAMQYSMIDENEIRPVGEISSGVFRAPFQEYVEPHYEGRGIRRRSWTQRVIGDDIDLAAVDPNADVEHARSGWTGKAFVFAYFTKNRTPSRLKMIHVRCDNRLPR